MVSDMPIKAIKENLNLAYESVIIISVISSFQSLVSSSFHSEYKIPAEPLSSKKDSQFIYTSILTWLLKGFSNESH